jgi:uncharacterized protein (UPF0371 family)
LERTGINVYKHYKIHGYPHNTSLIVSEEGLGKNEYIKTTKPLVVITAPGPASGKLGTCLSQLYHDAKLGIRSGYAKYETFPVWNLPLKHPVNLAYEAATADLNDVNMIDPYHFEKYNSIAVNYNRDVEAFPILKTIFERIYGSSPYYSPTDMGVNMCGFAIKSDEVACKASKEEIIRRYFNAQKYNFFGKFSDEVVEKIKYLMNQINISPDDRKSVKAALQKEQQAESSAVAIELPNGKIVTGRTSSLLTAPAAALLNCLKKLAKIDDSIPLISPNVLNPIQGLKSQTLNKYTIRLDSNEVLIALAIQAHTSPLHEMIMNHLSKLKGAQAHASEVVSGNDFSIYRKLGIHLTEEPKTHASRLFVSK